MEQTKKSTFKLLFYLKKNELKKNGNGKKAMAPTNSNVKQRELSIQ
jgi:hypothetical protein